MSVDRQGIVVEPHLRKQGLGSWLSGYCDKIADEAGEPTFVMPRTMSYATFQHAGYKQVGSLHIDFRQFGGESETDIFVWRREPFAERV